MAFGRLPLVKCPRCGHEFEYDEFKEFGKALQYASSKLANVMKNYKQKQHGR